MTIRDGWQYWSKPGELVADINNRTLFLKKKFRKPGLSLSEVTSVTYLADACTLDFEVAGQVNPISIPICRYRDTGIVHSARSDLWLHELSIGAMLTQVLGRGRCANFEDLGGGRDAVEIRIERTYDSAEILGRQFADLLWPQNSGS